MVGAGRVALGADGARALGRLRFVGLSLLLLPMYPFAALGTIWVSHVVALGMLAGCIVVVAFVAAYLAAWSALAGAPGKPAPSLTGSGQRPLAILVPRG